MKVQEVSLVDVAANLRKWVLLKRAEMTEKADEKKPEMKDAGPGVQKQEIMLPAQVKANLTGALADALELLGSLAEMVGAATVDDAAAVPPVVGEMLTQAAAMLSGAAEQLAAPPPESAPPQIPEGSSLPSEPMEPAAKEAADVSKADELGAEAEKALETAKGLLEQLAPLAKAGRRMAQRRLKELTKIVDGLVKLVRELGETDGVAKSAGEADPIAQFKAALDGLTARFDKMEGSIKLELAAVKKAVGEDAAKSAAIEKAAAERIDGISRALQTPRPSNVGEPGGKPVRKRRLTDEADMAAAVQKRR
jgi:hypothetical protein